MRSACFKNVAQQLEQLAIRIMLKVFMLYLLCKSCIIFVFIFYIILTNFSFDFDFCFWSKQTSNSNNKRESHATQQKLVLILRTPNIPKRLLLDRTQQY